MKPFKLSASICATVICISLPALAQTTTLPANTDWQLTHLKGVAQIDPTRTTISVDADQNLTGHAGCNRFQTRRSDDQIEPVTTTRMHCDPKLMQQEQAFLKALANTATVTSQPDSLQLKDAEGGNLARFSPRQLPRYYFDCNGEHLFIEMVRDQGIRLHRNGQVALLAQKPAEQGTRYEHPDKALIFIGQASQATLQEGNEKTRCSLTPPPKQNQSR